MGLFRALAGIVTDTVRATTEQNAQEAEFQRIQSAAQEELEKHNRSYQTLLNDEREKYQQYRTHCILSYFLVHEMQDKDMGGRDFSSLGQIPEEHRKSPEYTQMIEQIKDSYYSSLVESILKDEINICAACRVLKDLCTLQETAEEAEELTHALSALTDIGGFSKSIFSDCEDYDALLEELRGISVVDVLEPINVYGEGCEFYEQKKLKEALEHFLLTKYQKSDFDAIKKYLLALALDPEQDAATTEIYDGYKILCIRAFGVPHFEGSDEGKHVVLYPCVDMVIAEVLRHMSSNTLGQYQSEFEQWLKICGDALEFDQLTVLQKVFDYLQAYDYEKAVLSYMVESNSPRTAEQEERLKFLNRGNTTSSSSFSSSYDCFDVKAENGEILYDARFINWKSADVQKYFEDLILHRKTQNLYIAIEEWKKDVEIPNLFWKNSDVLNFIRKSLEENFGDEYIAEIKNGGPAMDGWADAIPSIYVSPANPDSRSADISYLIVGEQITKNMLHISIMVLLNGCCSENTVSTLTTLGHKVISVKEQHNPRIATIINTTKNILITSVENWMNQCVDNQSIY